MEIRALIVTVVIIGIITAFAFPQNYMSNISATKDAPIYTTYAAAMVRSEFTLDEGYHFLFYDSSRGLDFTTDTGGDLCLAFKTGADYVYESKDLYRQPVINTSVSITVPVCETPPAICCSCRKTPDLESGFLISTDLTTVHLPDHISNLSTRAYWPVTPEVVPMESAILYPQ